ncbi:MAG: MIP/aquaporin family protein [Nocardioidaceae bacterium]
MAKSSPGAGLESNLRELGRGLSELEMVKKNFDDPRLEWRRLFAEVLGTFFLVLVGAGGGVVNAVSHGQISRGTAVTAPGLMVMAIILFMGAISGAHLNPAVTLGFAIRGDFPWRRVPGYLVAELLGATLAVLFLWAMFGKVGSLGGTEPGPGVSDVQAMFMEMILTVGLFSAILGTASRSQNLGPLSALGVGGYIVLAGLWSSPISGASMNPARSFGPDLALGNFDHYWVYVVGPILGAAIAVGFAFILRSRADIGGAVAAQGALDQPDVPGSTGDPPESP